MNRLTEMKKFAFIGICVLSVAWGCKDDDDDVTPPVDILPTLKVTTTLSGANERPANMLTATGTVDGTLDQETNILKLNIAYSDTSASDSAGLDSSSTFLPTAWKIYKGAVDDTTGTEVVDLGTTFTTPFAFTDTLTAAQAADLKAGLYFVNIHTKEYPNGAIRGQLSAKE
ncbi:CHRD domain-containing protein [Dyadobacter sp. CY356]|uniref:CHRD domain-containing protein n=1 Tax=Dyadobacter sp. CY356 TaxID=2906442 RepID=UPI001F398F46|nr:CHRD domain-containing protein [Dyadobacter sp. CY356]MCF0054423.1 CHRD domain-containing protein [Dyadobacter sp. CY356]